ncbi:hypothetical protein QBC38DRAFT_457042 [Podospora fimiseda]|uniref:Uncharacterized protein n=1 Tax=Podospora fimiseda TaxID=252190 RepID=A0AAN7BLP8_9PEZI|nr:hypothetical protein QBC38DRAFT_457042 [Podospora fimiseda]
MAFWTPFAVVIVLCTLIYMVPSFRRMSAQLWPAVFGQPDSAEAALLQSVVNHLVAMSSKMATAQAQKTMSDALVEASTALQKMALASENVSTHVESRG